MMTINIDVLEGLTPILAIMGTVALVLVVKWFLDLFP